MTFRPLIYAPPSRDEIERHVATLMARHEVSEATARAALAAKIAAEAYSDGKWIVTKGETPRGMNHLAIHRCDGSVDHDWRELQRIKTAIAGADRWAAELYPPEDQLIDIANQYHLWVLPAGKRFPFGFLEGRRVVDNAAVAVELRERRA